MKSFILTFLISILYLSSLFSQITLNVQYVDQNVDPNDLTITYLSSLPYNSPSNLWTSWFIKVRWPKGSFGSECDNNPITSIVKLEPTSNAWGFDMVPGQPTVNDGFCYCNIFKQNFTLTVPQMVESDLIRIMLNNTFNVNTLEFSTGPVPAGVGSFSTIEGTAFGGTNQLLGFNLTALPITLTRFDAVWNKEGWVDLVWETESETNADGFVVERSLDGRKWEMIDKLSARGSVDSRAEYRTKDLRPEAGYNYYRLKMVDLDGTFEYSPLRSVFSVVRDRGLSTYPNPVERELFISTDRLLEDVRVEIFSMNGESVYFERMDYLAQNANTSILLPQLVTGAYNVVISQKNGEVIFTDVLIKK